MSSETKIVSFEMDEELYARLKAVAFESNQHTQSIILKAVREALTRSGKQGKLLSLIEHKGVLGITDRELKRTVWGKSLFDEKGECETLLELVKLRKIRKQKISPASNGRYRDAWVIHRQNL